MCWLQVALDQRGEVWEVWLEAPRIAHPVLDDTGRGGVRPLLPRHCREMVRLRPPACL